MNICWLKNADGSGGLSLDNNKIKTKYQYNENKLNKNYFKSMYYKKMPIQLVDFS